MAWLPLLVFFPTSASQPGQPYPKLELCRIDVSPCQREVNLAPGEEVTLAISVRAPESTIASPAQSLVAWHLRLAIEGSGVIDFPDSGTHGMPFREHDAPQSALASMSPIDVVGQASPPAGKYFRVKNSYLERDRRLEYAIALVGNRPEEPGNPYLKMSAGEALVLGTLTLRGNGAGTARLVIDSADTNASTLVMLGQSGELYPIELQHGEILASVNVEPAIRKIRLEGQIWSDVPDRHEPYQTFSKPFRLEIWESDSVPAWQGGSDVPLATFNGLSADDSGAFAIEYLPAEFILGNTYALRVTGHGTLSYKYDNLRIEAPVNKVNGSIQVVSVTLGPLHSGDLNGDNLVNDDDLSRLAASFGRGVRDAEIGTLADFNSDGVVDGQDFSLMGANYGRQGE